ncbi:hypothetical protein ABFX02_14G071900 [Erythranthe guttata]
MDIGAIIYIAIFFLFIIAIVFSYLKYWWEVSANKGLHSSVISSIPRFVFMHNNHHNTNNNSNSNNNNNDNDNGLLLECAVCLSSFEDGDECRKLGLCGHEFHVECIDRWLRSHDTCPICRARPDVSIAILSQ